MRLLAAIDGSAHSEKVIDSIAERAWEAGTEVHLVTVVPPYMEQSPITYKEELEIIRRLEYQESRKAAEQVLSNAAANLQKAAKNLKLSQEVLTGKAANSILEEAEKRQVDIILLAAHGKNMLSRLILGSVSQAVLINAPCSVAVVKSAHDKSKTGFNVLLPFDFSEESNRALDMVLSRTWSDNTHFRLLTVVSSPTSLVGFEMSSVSVQAIIEECDRATERAREFLCEKKAILEKKFPHCQVSTEVQSGNSKQVICDTATSWPADLVVMGAHGHSGFKKALIGSVSQAVVFNARCTVEIIRSASSAKKAGHTPAAQETMSGSGQCSS